MGWTFFPRGAVSDRCWGGTRRRGRFGARTLLEAYGAHVVVRPDAVAVAAGGGRLSYGALDRQANQLGRSPSFAGGWNGDGGGAMRGALLRRNLIVGMLGILKAAAPVSLDPATRTIASPSCWRIPARRCW